MNSKQNSPAFVARKIAIVLAILSSSFSGADAVEVGKSSSRHFGIQVVDSQTQRGVPMVQLRTVNDISLYSDSAGWIAFYEPGLMNRDVFFHVASHGYEFPKDGFGYRGVRLKTTPGKMAKIEVLRSNLAERLYRITGQGIYRDSLLLGRKPPVTKSLLNGDVLGQDTVQATVYRGRVHWFWGDTNRPSYPLGQFKTSGATSHLPEDGGLAPRLGVDLQYYVDDAGFSRPMAPFEGAGAIWLHGLFVLNDDGCDRMIAHYTRIKTLGEPLEHGLAVFDDSKETFEILVRFENDAVLFPRGQALCYEHGIDDYIYFCSPFPSVRVRANLDSVKDPLQYESFTCLTEGTQYKLQRPAVRRDRSGKLTVDPEAVALLEEVARPQLDLGAAGRVAWGWKKNTDAIDASRQQQLIDRGYLKLQDARMVLVDEHEKPVYLHAGSVHWNSFRRRWIMLAEQMGGVSSFLGEIWYAEAERLEGPWQNARHIVSHDRYSFYNPAHHRFFDEQNGQIIYFEGTYANTFSAASDATPKYNYNQVMYRLDLSDSRLNLPANRE